MRNYEEKFGNEGYGAYGQGNYIQSLPQPQRVTYGDFSGGLDSKDSREDTPPNSSPNALDVEVTLRDRLRPVPGTTTIETLARTAQQVVLHASLDYTSELVLFDAPYLGVKTSGTTVWTDVGLPVAERRFASVNFGGVLLFSNGRVGMYVKKAGESTVALVEKAPAAHSFANFAGRVFAGASIIGGNREPLGVSWSAATSNHEDWEEFDEDGVSTGAGFELLIDDMAQGNYIVALRTMGLDFLAILMRNSIWIGRKTNQYARPADFQPRVSGVGAVNEATCVVTRFGIIHLHDSGVYIFDGNSSTLISEQINSELLPLDGSQLGLYSSSYNPTSKQVYLFTPTCTWVYHLEKRRWHKRSLIATGASVFASQIAAVTWAELTGTWAQQDETWEEYKAKESELPSYVFLGPTGGVLAKEDAASSSNFGTAMEPYWEFPLIQGITLNQLVTTKKVFVDYEGEGVVDLYLPDNDSEFIFRRTAALPVAAAPRLKPSFCEFTGKGVGLRIVFASGKPEILRVQLEFLLRGPRIEPVIPPALTMETDGLLFYDTFDRATLGSDYAIENGANATISLTGGNLSVLLTANGAFPFIRLLPAETQFANGVVQAQLTHATRDLYYIGVAGRVSGARDDLILADFGKEGAPAGIRLFQELNTTYTLLAFQQRSVPATYDQPFEIKLVMVGAAVDSFYKASAQDLTGTLGHISGTTTHLVSGHVGLVFLTTGTGSFTGSLKVGYVAVMASDKVTVNNLPDGYKIRLNGQTIPAAGGIAEFTGASLMWPLPGIEVLNAVDSVVISNTDDVWGGSVFTYG